MALEGIYKTEVELIREIIKYHPVYEAGRKRDWSWWLKGVHGGRGEWRLHKLIYATWEELDMCLAELRLEENEFKFNWNEQLIKE